MPRRDAVERIQDILAAIERIAAYTRGLDYEGFSKDVRTTEAVQYNFIVIGEAAGHLSPDLTDLHPDIPWAEMRGLRNVVAHTYFAISVPVLWETVRSDLPPLIEPLRALLGKLTRNAVE